MSKIAATFEPNGVGGDGVAVTVDEVQGDLVAEEIQVDPAIRRAARAEAHEATVEIAGPVEIVELDAAASRAAVEPMAIRYLGEEMGRGYAGGAIAEDEIRIRLRPERWFSVDYSKPG